MAIRLAQPDDIDPLVRLWDDAFPGDRPAADRVRQLETGVPYGGLDVTWVESDEGTGRLLGAFRAYRMTEYLAGAALPMLGLAGVAVGPSARRRGVGRRMCEAAIRIGRERGDLVSVLYPFRPSFYRSLGWAAVGELRAFRFRPGALGDAEERRHVRPAAGDDDLDALLACYDRVAVRSNGPLRREPDDFRHNVRTRSLRPFVYEDDGGGADGDGGATGYLLADFRPGRSPESGELYVRELIARDAAAYRGLLAWMASQGDQWASIRYDARPDELFEHRLADPRPPRFEPERELWFPTSRVLHGPMLRVLDVPGALRARPQWAEAGEVALTFQFEVDDPQVPENRGPWTVAVTESGAEVHPASAAAGADVRLSTNAATFAQIYSGELSPSEAARLGYAAIDGAADALDRTFRLPGRFRLYDEF